MDSKLKSTKKMKILVTGAAGFIGFFTSKEGGTKVLRYVPVPGKYDGNIEYKKGHKAWAT